MIGNFSRGLALLAITGLGLFFSTGRASASVLGALALDGGAVTVTATTLDWNGTATVNASGGATTLTYDSGTAVVGGTAVSLSNLPGSLPTPIVDFMTFAGIPASGNPSLEFTLDVAGPGSANTDCSAGGLASHGGECSVFGTSPLILRQAVNGTEVDLGVSGTATDGTSTVSNWAGTFSDTITVLTGSTGTITPAEVQAFFLANPSTASITTTYSGTFNANVVPTVPEPSSVTMMLLGSGLILFAVSRRRKQQSGL